MSRVSDPPRSKLYEGLVVEVVRCEPQVDSGVAGHHARTHYIVELNSRAKIAAG